MNWIIVIFIWIFIAREYLTGPVPIKLSGHTKNLTPYIKYWEEANYDRAILDIAHKKHIEQKHHRWKRSLNVGEYGPAHEIRLTFFAHDREFRLVLKQDPLSVFAADVQIENTHGPIDYDISRIYSGTLEDEDSHIHAVLTKDNLLDGTIETSSDNYYIEPTHRYSRNLYDAGVHSIIYKLNDVDMKKKVKGKVPSEHCASERLRLKNAIDLKQQQNHNKSNLSDNNDLTHSRKKRWLPDEYLRNDNERRRDPPLPLDLDVPYNDDLNILTPNRETPPSAPPVIEKKSDRDSGDVGSNRSWVTTAAFPPTKSRTPFRRGDIVNNNNNNNNNYKISNRSYDRGNNQETKIYTKHKNIIVSTYDSSSNNNNNFNRSNYFDRFDDELSDIRNINRNNNNNNNFNKSNSNNDRPSHKTHVEIITKNGATRRPYIIVNNYNPPSESTTANDHNRPLSTNYNNAASASASAPRFNYNRKITCMLYLQADHTFFQKMGSDEASIEAITRHVQRANSIYKNTDFNNDGKPDNITFMIKRIKVHNMNALNDPSYRFPGNYGVEKFLELFSEEDYDAFCLAYMFTYRDFEMGTLGLAWTGDLKNAGGVCEKNGHYRGSLKSLNTGIVTLLNYGKHVPPAVSHVTLAHEIGHNFGSPHDPEQCTPGGEDGNFIMFARATSGDKKNNNKFSPCSLKSIEPVLVTKARSAKGCFTEPQTSICGNGVVEPGEECDCGWEEDCKDSCCFPMSRNPRMDERPCTLTPGSLCSQSQGPCCTTDCRLKFGDKCRDDNGCRDPSFCDGRMPQCPPSINKPNKTICNKEFVCFMGECTGSICLAYGLESCQCIPGEHDDKIKSCELCCKLPGEDKPCRSSFEWNEAPYDVPNMFAKPGTPCNDYNGYCDVFQKCREVDPSGPLATLRKLLLSEESIATFKNWMQQNWYTIVLGVIAVVILLIISTKLLAKRSKLKLKTVTIIHSATTETVRLPSDNNGVIVHRAVRTKVPFKKKVRGKRNLGTKKKQDIIKSNGNVKETKDRTTTTATTGEGLNDLNKKRTQAATTLQQQLQPQQHQLQQQQQQQQQQHKKSSSSNNSSGSNSNDTTENSNSKGNLEKPNILLKKPATTTTKKHSSKEIIDYSKRNGHHSSSKRAASLTPGHTNTFHKVQKWLLESPIVAQPLSHIEHSSKVRKVMSKSQSTPERLLHKSPQKAKNNAPTNAATAAANDNKVRMQVVYKPFKFSPFKFSLRFSKNAKVRTHVLGNGNSSSNSKAIKSVNKHPFKATARIAKRSSVEQQQQQQQQQQGVTTAKPSTTAAKNMPSSTRTAFLLQKSSDDEDNHQILTAEMGIETNEPNYETLKPLRSGMGSGGGTGGKSTSTENLYEIVRPIDASAGIPAAAVAQLNRSSSKHLIPSHHRASNVPSVVLRQSFDNDYKHQQLVANAMQRSRDISGSSTSINNKFGSTQNLIKSKDSNFVNSSNSKSSRHHQSNKSRESTKDVTQLQAGLQPALPTPPLPFATRISHNHNQWQLEPPLQPSENTVLPKHHHRDQIVRPVQSLSKSQSSSSASTTHSTATTTTGSTNNNDNNISNNNNNSNKILPAVAQRNPNRSNNINNIPRASVVHFPPHKDFSDLEKSAVAPPPPPPSSLPPPIAVRTSLNLAPTTTASKSSSSSSIPEQRSHQRSNSLRQQAHSFVPPPLPRKSQPAAAAAPLNATTIPASTSAPTTMAPLPHAEKLFLPNDINDMDMDQSISDCEYLVS